VGGVRLERGDQVPVPMPMVVTIGSASVDLRIRVRWVGTVVVEVGVWRGRCT
jgi:hypothetical protein